MIKKKIIDTLIIFFTLLVIIPIAIMPIFFSSFFICIILLILMPFKVRNLNTLIVNINNIYKHYSIKQKIKLYIKINHNVSMLIAEYIKMINPFSKISNRIINKESLEDFQKISKKYKDSPCFFFTMHFGNWEIFSKPLCAIDEKLSAIGKRQRKLSSFINKQRGGSLNKDSSLLKNIIKNIIPNKKHIVSLFDQKQKNGFNLKFMGHDCSTPNVLPKLALKYKIPIVLLYVIKEKNNKYSIKMNDITNNINYKDQSEENLKSLCQDINDYFSNIVFATPQQWFCWLYKRWHFNYDKK